VADHDRGLLEHVILRHPLLNTLYRVWARGLATSGARPTVSSARRPCSSANLGTGPPAALPSSAGGPHNRAFGMDPIVGRGVDRADSPARVVATALARHTAASDQTQKRSPA
jgi:hypothetical protein